MWTSSFYPSIGMSTKPGELQCQSDRFAPVAIDADYGIADIDRVPVDAEARLRNLQAVVDGILAHEDGWPGAVRVFGQGFRRDLQADVRYALYIVRKVGDGLPDHERFGLGDADYRLFERLALELCGVRVSRRQGHAQSQAPYDTSTPGQRPSEGRQLQSTHMISRIFARSPSRQTGRRRSCRAGLETAPARVGEKAMRRPVR